MPPQVKRNGLVILSGGQDSVTCLGVALGECDSVEAISFYYNQRHEVELDAAREVCARRNVPLHVMDLSVAFAHMKSSALIDHTADISVAHSFVKNAPASFVPVRNALFLTVAFGYALEHGMDTLYAGMSQTDYSGYPDCRHAFIAKLMRALNMGYEADIGIRTPLMHLTKGQTFDLANKVGVLADVLELSVTCYEGRTDKRNVWGLGCGECPACLLRKKGWDEYQG